MDTQLHENVINEMQALNLNLYTPMTREDWERNTTIMERILERVGIGKKKSD